MPRFVSPLRPRLPKAYLQEIPPDTVQEAHTGETEEYPENHCIVEGSFRRVRDDSLLLLSQGIEHRLIRSAEGPFQIFILPEHEAKAREQLDLFHRENPPREENPPIPLTFSLQPL